MSRLASVSLHVSANLQLNLYPVLETGDTSDRPAVTTTMNCCVLQLYWFIDETNEHEQKNKLTTACVWALMDSQAAYDVSLFSCAIAQAEESVLMTQGNFTSHTTTPHYTQPSPDV